MLQHLRLKHNAYNHSSSLLRNSFGLNGLLTLSLCRLLPTALLRYALLRRLRTFILGPAGPFFLSAAKGARTSVYLASSPAVEGVSGQYFVKCKPRKPRPWALDADAARQLWEVSEELVGLAAAERT